jgi:hypothetical protein
MRPELVVVVAVEVGLEGLQDRVDALHLGMLLDVERVAHIDPNLGNDAK